MLPRRPVLTRLSLKTLTTVPAMTLARLMTCTAHAEPAATTDHLDRFLVDKGPLTPIAQVRDSVSGKSGAEPGKVRQYQPRAPTKAVDFSYTKLSFLSSANKGLPKLVLRDTPFLRKYQCVSVRI